MTIRQEESTPIGDFFHDSGIRKVFNELYNKVDDFEVDTDELKTYCEKIIETGKKLLRIIKSEEDKCRKSENEEKIRSLIKNYE